MRRRCQLVETRAEGQEKQGPAEEIDAQANGKWRRIRISCFSLPCTDCGGCCAALVPLLLFVAGERARA